MSLREADRSGARIAIVGGGLSGLYAAWLLAERGIRDWVLFEARSTLGGRILSIPVAGSGDGSATAASTARSRFDLGPAWFWPSIQGDLSRLIDTLGLARFAQFESGDMMYERTTGEPPVRVRGFVSSPVGMRLAGGTASLIDALHGQLERERILCQTAVRTIRQAGDRLELDSRHASGATTTWRVQHVLLALPPRLAAQSIAFEPSLPDSLSKQWRSTATWMAPHAKYVAVFDTPFWREAGLSGAGRSGRGPMTEIHDASMPGQAAALFGFLGVPPHVRKSAGDAVVKTHCRAQLVRLFGARAAEPRAEFFKDWASDPWTSTAADMQITGDHPEPPDSVVPTGPWKDRLTGIASEWSVRFPGYLAGAVDAAQRGVERVLDGRQSAVDPVGE
jgi:monoamine oxidase